MTELKRLIWQLTVTDWAPKGWEVIWLHEPLPFEGLRNGSLGAYVELNITNFKSRGVDDYRQALVTPPPTIPPAPPAIPYLASAMYGLREFTLSMDCRSFSLDAPAFDILEAVRIRLNNPRSILVNSTLQSNGLAWIRSHPIITLPAEKQDIDNRMIWRNVLDVEFGWLSAAQETDDQGGYIETVGDDEKDNPAGSNDIPGTISPPGSV